MHDRSPYPYRAPATAFSGSDSNPYTGSSGYGHTAFRARPVMQPVIQPSADQSYPAPQLQIDIHPRARNRVPVDSNQPLPMTTGQVSEAFAPPMQRSSVISVRSAPATRLPDSSPTVYLPSRPVPVVPIAAPVQASPAYVVPTAPPPVAALSYQPQPIQPLPVPVAVAAPQQRRVTVFPEPVLSGAGVTPAPTMPAILPDPAAAGTPVYVPNAPEPAGVKASSHITYYDAEKPGGEPSLDAPIDAVKVEPSQTLLKAQAAPPPPPEDPKHLTGETETILNHLPHDLFPATQTRMAKGGFGMSRAHTTTDIPKAKEFTASTSIGAKIAVKRQSIDVSYELEKAYNALLQGSTEVAIGIYKDVLAAEPNNKNALFGLATTYHKLGMLAQARPLYGRLLEMDPYNKEVLNNFLAMVGEEAPESAILYLEQLKGANHEFSPIYAQLAQLYAKQHDYPNAIENMQQAVAISPENMVYKYNLAVLYDTAKDYRRAEVLYRQIIDSGLKGEEIPASMRDIQERLIYLGSK